jgi:tRNA(adenine34) deaminase
MSVTRHTDEHWMTAALAAGQRVPSLPFGAVIVDDEAQRVLASGWNRGASDPTAHGEVDVIRRLASQEHAGDWSALTLYTTAEPCPMCASAILWSGIGRVVYGVSIPWLVEHGWWQIDLRAADVFACAADRPVDLRGGVCERECAALFAAPT